MAYYTVTLIYSVAMNETKIMCSVFKTQILQYILKLLLHSKFVYIDASVECNQKSNIINH